MTPRDYEIAFLAQTAWRLSTTDNVDEVLAVACTIRNWVLPRAGVPPVYATFTEACLDFLTLGESRPLPDIRWPAFATAPDAILRHAADIYDGIHPDVTATPTLPAGAKFFGRGLSMDPVEHPLLGTWGGQQFYA